MLETVDCRSPLHSVRLPGVGSGPGCSLDADKAKGMTRTNVGPGEGGAGFWRRVWGGEGPG